MKTEKDGSCFYPGAEEKLAECTYEVPSIEELTKITTMLLEAYAVFLRHSDYPEDIEFVIRHRDVADIAIRVDRRSAYYRFFHNMNISEKKRASLYAYWIAKLRPFTIVDERYSESEDAAYINEKFAAYYLITAVLIPNGDVYDAEKIIFSSEFFEKLVYAFRYRSITIDSVILLADSMTAETLSQNFSSSE